MKGDLLKRERVRADIFKIKYFTEKLYNHTIIFIFAQ